MALRLNATAPEATDATPEPCAGENSALKEQELERWENEGGEVPTVPTPKPVVVVARPLKFVAPLAKRATRCEETTDGQAYVSDHHA